MVNDTLVVIPARAGSKGIPNKNMQLIHGVPLLAYSIRFAKAVGFPHIYISTDSAEYETFALSLGAQSVGRRPSHLADDHAKTVDVMIDLYQNLNQTFRYLLVLQPTSPQRELTDIGKLTALIADPKVSSVVSVSKLEEPHPFKLKSLSAHGFLEPFLADTSSEIPRQQLPPVYRLNGAYYLIRPQSLLETRSFFPKNKTKGYVMNDIVNLDTPSDLVLLESQLKEPF